MNFVNLVLILGGLFKLYGVIRYDIIANYKRNYERRR